MNHEQHRNRKIKTYRFSNFTIHELERLSHVMDTNRTAVIEIAVAKLGERYLKKLAA